MKLVEATRRMNRRRRRRRRKRRNNRRRNNMTNFMDGLERNLVEFVVPLLVGMFVSARSIDANFKDTIEASINNHALLIQISQASIFAIFVYVCCMESEYLTMKKECMEPESLTMKKECMEPESLTMKKENEVSKKESVTTKEKQPTTTTEHELRRRLEELEKMVQLMHAKIKHGQSPSVPTTKPKVEKPKFENDAGSLPPKYQRMLKMGIPRKAVLQKMVLDGVRGPHKKEGGGVTAESLRKMRKITKLNGVRPRKKKPLPPEKSSGGPLRVTPDILANARANLKKSKRRKNVTKKKENISSNNPLGITVDILKQMRSGLKRTKRRQPTRVVVSGSSSSLTAIHPGVTVEKLRTIVLNKVNLENRVKKDYSGTTALRRHMAKIRLRKTSLPRSPGGTPLSRFDENIISLKNNRMKKQSFPSSSPRIEAIRRAAEKLKRNNRNSTISTTSSPIRIFR